VTVRTAKEMDKWMTFGDSRRATGATAMNAVRHTGSLEYTHINTHSYKDTRTPHTSTNTNTNTNTLITLRTTQVAVSVCVCACTSVCV